MKRFHVYLPTLFLRNSKLPREEVTTHYLPPPRAINVLFD